MEEKLFTCVGTCNMFSSLQGYNLEKTGLDLTFLCLFLALCSMYLKLMETFPPRMKKCQIIKGCLKGYVSHISLMLFLFSCICHRNGFSALGEYISLWVSVIIVVILAVFLDSWISKFSILDRWVILFHLSIFTITLWRNSYFCGHQVAATGWFLLKWVLKCARQMRTFLFRKEKFWQRVEVFMFAYGNISWVWST